MKIGIKFIGPNLDIFNGSAQAIHWREIIFELAKRKHDLQIVSLTEGNLDGIPVVTASDVQPDIWLQRYYIETPVVESNVPTYLEANYSFVHGSESSDKYKREAAWEEHERQVLSGVNGIFTISQVMREFLVMHYGVNERDVTVFPLGIDLNRIGKRKIIYNKKTTVGFIGSFKGYHDTEMLVALVKHVCPLKDVKFLFVGAGDKLETAQNELKEFDEQVTFTGRVKPETIPDYLQKMDIAIMLGQPYNDPVIPDFHGFPIKLLEYMAAGLPVLIPDHGEPAKQFTHGDDAFVYEPGNVQQMADLLLLISNDRMLCNEIGLGARGTVESRFSIQNSIDVFEQTWRRDGLMGGE